MNPIPSVPISIRIGAPLNSEPVPKLQWVEIASSFHIPSFQIVGLPSQEVHESRERVRAAIEASGFDFPRRRLVLNLSPASVRKQGTGIDLAIALSILVSSSAKFGASNDQSDSVIAWGELGLNGSIKEAGQILRGIYAAWDAKACYLLFPRSEEEAAREKLDLLVRSQALSGPPPVLISVSHLKEAWETVQDLMNAKREKSPAPLPVPVPLKERKSSPNSSHDQLLPLSPALQRVLGVAASGGHHLLLLGPRGSGKSHATEWLAALQPPLPAKIQMTQMLLTEMNSGYSSVGRDHIRRIGVQVKPAALIGVATSNFIRPGEFSMAHGGLLIADEFPEWARDSRESLREPMERGVVTLNRARCTLELPARFTLAATGNFCPCGGWPARVPIPSGADPSHPSYQRCTCAKRTKDLYLARLSGPILDRTDIVLVLSGSFGRGSVKSMNLDDLRAKVQAARKHALKNWGEIPALLPSHSVEKLISENPTWEKSPNLADSASLRSRHKILRLALSLAAWDGAPGPHAAHFAEAYCYRPERLGIAN